MPIIISPIPPIKPFNLTPAITSSLKLCLQNLASHNNINPIKMNIIPIYILIVMLSLLYRKHLADFLIIHTYRYFAFNSIKSSLLPDLQFLLVHWDFSVETDRLETIRRAYTYMMKFSRLYYSSHRVDSENLQISFHLSQNLLV